MKKHVTLIDHTAAHYRKDVYDSLLNCTGFQFEIIAGNNYDGVKCLAGNYKLLPYRKVRLLNHTFYYLAGCFKHLCHSKQDIIICSGFDPHLVHTVLIFIFYRLILRKQFVWWSHATSGKQGYPGFIVRKFFYKTSTGVLAYSKQGKINLVKMGLPGNKIQIVNNSINNEEYGFHNNEPVSNEKKFFEILYCGRLTENKKLEDLLYTLKVLKNKNLFPFHCTIVGDGACKTDLELMAERLQVQDHIDFTGGKYEKETFPFFFNADIFVYPGGIGLSLVQAMSFGIPVLTTDNMSLHGPEIELLNTGFNGDFCIDGSPEDYAEKLIKWKDVLHNQKILIKQNCINTIKDNGYMPDKMYEAIIDFLNKNN